MRESSPLQRAPRRLARAIWGTILAAVSCSAAQAAGAEHLVKTVCVACHGEQGNSVVAAFPKLAGLQAEYLAKQLQDYLSGKRKNEAMAPALASLESKEVAELAAYYAAQKTAPGKVEDPALAAAGKKLYEDGNTETGVPACMGCHQPLGEGNARFPRLAAQHPAYTLKQMADFKSGARANDKGKVMRAVAERLTEQEMKAVSEYLAGL